LISGILTAVLDNVLAVAIFIPLVKDLLPTPVGSIYLWWSLLFGATLFGNLTIIGSTANIIAIGLMEKRGYKKISFMEWLRYGLPVVIVSVSLAFLLVYLQYLYGW
ncbi:MAG: anion permease, partial [Candidatus Anstonellales archaeon]